MYESVLFRSNNRLLGLGIACAALFAVMAWVMKTTPAMPGDRTLFDLVQSWESSGRTSFMLGLSWIGGTPAVSVICLIAILADVLGGYTAAVRWICLAVNTFRAKGWLKR